MMLVLLVYDHFIKDLVVRDREYLTTQSGVILLLVL